MTTLSQKPFPVLLIGPAERGGLPCRDDSSLSEFELTEVGELETAIGELGRTSYSAVLLTADKVEPALDELRRLRAAAPEVPVVMIGGDDEDELLEWAVREGAQDCITRSSLERLGRALLERSVRYAIERQRLVSELERARMLGLHLAHHDTLTDLPNRQLFRSRLRQLILQARRRPQSLAVLFLDLDRFKQINDTLGHGVGDRILQIVAKRLKGCIRETDIAARRGGDEFTAILDGIRRGQDAARVAKKILAEISKPYMVDGHELFVDVSIGISLFPADGRDVETLVKHADIAMYRAKARGGHNYQFYLPDMNDRAIERMEMENSLRQALDRDQFVLHYQPQVEMATGRIIGMEALVRWQHPDLGLVYPDEFIPLAEETGLIVPLGEWVLQEACRQNRTWQRAALPRVTVAVNFSARQFQFKRPVERVRAALEETGLDPEYLEIELTESAVMKDASFAIDTLRQLRELGVSIAIDDFGTGHSSLAYLKRFPITKLKIDKTFIRTLLVDPKDAALTCGIIGMAHSLELKAVAEGVEARAQLDFLREHGCDELQGYFFSPPRPQEGAEELLASGWI